jgi:hypothetical protein
LRGRNLFVELAVNVVLIRNYQMTFLHDAIVNVQRLSFKSLAPLHSFYNFISLIVDKWQLHGSSVQLTPSGGPGVSCREATSAYRLMNDFRSLYRVGPLGRRERVAVT